MRIIKSFSLFTLFVALIPTLGMAELKIKSDMVINMDEGGRIVHKSNDVRDALALATKKRMAIRGVLQKVGEWFVMETRMGEHRKDDIKEIIKSYNVYNLIPRPLMPSEKKLENYLDREVLLDGSMTFVMTHRKEENYQEIGTGYRVYTDRDIYNFTVTDIQLVYP